MRLGKVSALMPDLSGDGLMVILLQMPMDMTCYGAALCGNPKP